VILCIKLVVFGVFCGGEVGVGHVWGWWMGEGGLVNVSKIRKTSDKEGEVL